MCPARYRCRCRRAYWLAPAGILAGVRLIDPATTSVAVAGVRARSIKIDLLAACLQRADPGETAVLTHYLAGELRQRRTGLGPAALRAIPAPADHSTLSLHEVDAELEQIAALSGSGSAGARRMRFHALLGRATAVEQRFLAGLVTGDLRQGALEGVLTEAVARASGVEPADIRRAVTLAGSLVPVAVAVLANGTAGLARFTLTVGSPVRPMLASPSPGLGPALAQLGRAAVEWKLDGIRVQIHRLAGTVRVFTRTLDDITGRVPELVDTTLSLPVHTIVLDGEAIVLTQGGRPAPFQRTASRIGRQADVGRSTLPLSVFFFDCLHLDGDDLIARPAAKRWEALAGVVPDHLWVPRTVTDDVSAAGRFLDSALALGHEGVVVKSLEAQYAAGRRGSGWLKVKPRHTLDLVVLAAEWGHGRRRGWLSNLHLGARDVAGEFGPPGGFVMLGKTFKGLRDDVLEWQTNRFQELKTHEDDWTVHVRPEQVVEIAFDGVQQSPRYPGGAALRFARVLRYRDDKTSAEADTIDTVLSYLKG